MPASDELSGAAPPAPVGASRSLLLALVAASGLLAGCGKKHEPQAATVETLPPAAVRVQKIETVKQPAVEEVVGTVAAEAPGGDRSQGQRPHHSPAGHARPVGQAGRRAGGTRHAGDSGQARPGQRRVPAGGAGIQPHRQSAQAERRHPGRIRRRAGALQRRQGRRGRGGGAVRLREDRCPVRRRGGPQAGGRGRPGDARQTAARTGRPRRLAPGGRCARACSPATSCRKRNSPCAWTRLPTPSPARWPKSHRRPTRHPAPCG